MEQEKIYKRKRKNRGNRNVEITDVSLFKKYT